MQRASTGRRLVESVIVPESLDKAVDEGIRRIEEVFAGKISGLTEAEFRAAVG